MRRRSRFGGLQRGLMATAIALAIGCAGLLVRPIAAHADGWGGTDQLPTPLQNQVAVTDGTYLYIAGGAASGTKSAVYSALVNSNGSLGTWKTLPAMPKGLYNHAGTLQNGYIFITGGQISKGTAQATVYSAAQQAGGSLSAWTTNAKALPQALYDHVAVSASGYVFVLGGFSASNVAQSTVYSAAQSGGSLGAWTAQTSLPVAEGELGATVNNGYIYVVGGHGVTGSGSGQAGVYAAKIGANGTIGAWATLTSLPQARWDLGVVAAGGYLWAIGGFNGSGVATSTVYRATINADGTIGSWLTLTPVPSTLGEHTVTTAQGYLFIAGGKVGKSGASSTIYDAPVAGPWLMLSAYGVSAGTSVTASGTGYAAGETVNITFAGASIATATADSSGSFGLNGSAGASFVVPGSTSTGTYAVIGTGQTSGHSGQAQLSVTGSSTATPTATATSSSTPTPTPTQPTGGSGGDWNQYLYDTNHSGYNPNFSAFGTGNAASLVKKWSYTTGGLIAGNPAVATINNPTASACAGSAVPIAFTGSWNGYLYAVNATTGAVCWKTFLAQDIQPTPNSFCITTLGITSAPTVITLPGTSTQVVYVGASDIMFEVNAATGQIIWKSVLAGQDVGTFSDAYIWSSPAYSPQNNTLYTSTASFCDETSPIAGAIFALDPATGAVKAHMVPAGSGAGAGVWGTPTVSPSQSTVYITTGNAFVTSSSGTQQACPTAVPLSCAVVALDWNTLAAKGSWQIPSNNLDLDFGTTPDLFPGPNGATWLTAGSKNGKFYVFDTANLAAGPKWSVQLAGGGGNPVNGMIEPAAYYPGTVNNGSGTSCTGVLFTSSGKTTLNGTSYGGAVSAFCAQTGKVLWQQGTSGLHWAAPVLANGMVVDQQGYVMEVRSMATGQVLYSYTTGHNIYGAATFANGLLYVGSTDHSLYAFGL